MEPQSPSQPVLILGAGINGCALARELLLNGVSVCLVDQADISSGATAASSRLIHGGLRYLEYGESDLARESLAERTRLLRLAPQSVRPLRLLIPVTNRFGGVLHSARKFLSVGHASGLPNRKRQARSLPHSARGWWLVRLGLWFYDHYARDPTLPDSHTVALDDPQAPPVSREKFRWLCAYYDAQIGFPERFVLALLEDARRLAAEHGLSFEVFTYHQAALDGRVATVHRRGDRSRVARAFEPAAIVNATGAWVDQTLAALHVPSRRLIGGTKGSHFITPQARLREMIGDQGLYTEASDGRPIFILPFADQTLVGTTDEPYDGDPADAVAREDELQYLLSAVQETLPGSGLTREDITLHYSGVRPLPFVDASTPAAITRRHLLTEHRDAVVPTFSIIGGKLTTCRSLAEETAATLLTRLGRAVRATSRERLIPGAEAWPGDAALEHAQRRLAERHGCSTQQVAAMWTLCGTRVGEILATVNGPCENLDGTAIPHEFVRWVIQHEWVQTLDDLIERRLLLLYHHPLTAACLRQLAQLLVEAGLLEPNQIDEQVAASVERLKTRHGKQVLQERESTTETRRHGDDANS
ncbi:MAG: glycerol-3-phosphate dehydrogenase/oxidase [Planctomycetes bacterium]|nr:glycerol-3-phosphate dehydrogenase/oxidase [Planctomycetota bacterium]